MITTNMLKIQGHPVGIFTEEPPTPVLPQYTIRAQFQTGYRPYMGYSQNLVDSNLNIWDIYRPERWEYIFSNCSQLLSIIAANSTGVISMNGLFDSCSNLTSVALFDTSSVTDMGSMFYHCSGLTSIPLFDMSNVTSIMHLCTNCTSLTFIPLFNTSSVEACDWAFNDCINVQTGALALYNQLSSQGTVMYCDGAFRNCGSNTTTGAAELAQIPSSWK